MSTELPTKPGPYYWRESEGDEWEMWHVLDNGSALTAHRGFNVAFLPDLGGQWLPIPTADELVELQRKAKAYDEGQPMIKVAYHGVTMDRFIHPENKVMLEHYGSRVGYTSRKVRIVEEVGK